MYYVDKFWRLDVENVIKCWPKMSWNVNHKFRIYKHSISNIYEHFDNIWSHLVAGSDGMLPNVIKMFINVGNWMSEMWSNVGPTCLGMWKKVRPMSSNVTFRVSGGAGMLSNVTKMFINVGNGMLKMWSNVGQKCHGMWGISSANVIKCWIYGNWRCRNVIECYQNVKKCWKLDVKNVIKCWPKMSWNVRHKFRECYQMLDLW